MIHNKSMILYVVDSPDIKSPLELVAPKVKAITNKRENKMYRKCKMNRKKFKKRKIKQTKEKWEHKGMTTWT